MSIVFAVLYAAGILVAAALPFALVDRTLRARRGLPPRDWLYVDDTRGD